MATAPKTTPATLEKAVALLGQFRQEWSNEKRHLELRIKSLEHRLFGSRSEKLPIEDQQLALIDEVFAQQEAAATQDVVVDPDIEKRVAKSDWSPPTRPALTAAASNVSSAMNLPSVWILSRPA